MESPLIDTLKTVHVLGVEWTIEEVKSMIFPFISAAKVLAKFVFFQQDAIEIQENNDLIAAVTETEESERIIKTLFYKKQCELTSGASWLQQDGNFDKVVKLVSNINQLKKLKICHCSIDRSMVVQILESLNTQIETIEELELRGVDWDTDESVIALTKFIANAPKLNSCSIEEQPRRKILLQRKKKNDQSQGFVKAFLKSTKKVLSEVETSLTQDIQLFPKDSLTENNQFFPEFREKGWAANEAGQKTLKIVLAGDTAVGKSCLITNYLNNSFTEDYEPTVLDVYKGIKNVGKKYIEIEIHDTTGDEHLGVNRKVQYRDADVFMICVAANNPESLESVLRWKFEIQEIEPSKPIALILTKADQLEIVDDGVDVGMIKQKQKELNLQVWAKTSSKAWEDFNAHIAFNKAITEAYKYKYEEDD